jgi:predicted enzyme related to lactoylglutathione lyase
MFKRVAFTMYPVTDMTRARDFYEKTLGLECSNEFADGAWIEYDLPGGGCFALTTMAKGVEPSADAGGSIAFEVEDLMTLVENLKQKAVTFKLDVFESPVCHLAVIVDSEGNAVTLHQLKRVS